MFQHLASGDATSAHYVVYDHATNQSLHLDLAVRAPTQIVRILTLSCTKLVSVQ